MTFYPIQLPGFTYETHDQLRDVLLLDARNEHGILAPKGEKTPTNEAKQTYYTQNVMSLIRDLVDVAEEFSSIHNRLLNGDDPDTTHVVHALEIILRTSDREGRLTLCTDLVASGLSAPQHCFPKYLCAAAAQANPPQVDFNEEQTDVLWRRQRRQQTLREWHAKDFAMRPHYHHYRQNALVKLNCRWAYEQKLESEFKGVGLDTLAIQTTGAPMKHIIPPERRLTDQSKPQAGNDPA